MTTLSADAASPASGCSCWPGRCSPAGCSGRRRSPRAARARWQVGGGNPEPRHRQLRGPARRRHHAGGPAHTAVQRGVYDGPVVSRTRGARPPRRAAAPSFSRRRPSATRPARSGVCLEGGVCQPEPSLRDAGRAAIEGLRGRRRHGRADRADAVASQYLLPVGVTLAYPPFAPGAPVALSVSGGEVGAFSLSGAGISPLEVLTPQPMTVEAGRPIELRWRRRPRRGDRRAGGARPQRPRRHQGQARVRGGRLRVAHDGRRPARSPHRPGHRGVPVRRAGPQLADLDGAARGPGEAQPPIPRRNAGNRDPGPESPARATASAPPARSVRATSCAAPR